MFVPVFISSIPPRTTPTGDVNVQRLTSLQKRIKIAAEKTPFREERRQNKQQPPAQKRSTASAHFSSIQPLETPDQRNDVTYLDL